MRYIAKWNETFESADTRKRQRLGWLSIPTGNDSAGYIELMSHGERGVRAFGVFLAICQWSATQRQETRGQLARSDGRPVNDRQIAAIIRISTDIVTDAIELLSSREIAWICEKTEQNPQSASDLPVVCQQSASDLPGLCKEKEKEKEKYRDREKDSKDSIVSGETGEREVVVHRTAFAPPSIQEVIDFVLEKHLCVDAVEFCSFYESKFWMVGKNKMKDWRAAAVGWDSRKRKDVQSDQQKYLSPNERREQTTANAIELLSRQVAAARASGAVPASDIVCIPVRGTTDSFG
jgi:hypothetical protein